MRSTWMFGTVAALTILTSSLPSFAADWPGFRGPAGNGVADAAARPATKWDANTNIAWKVPLEAPGNSSPIILGDTVYVTVADREGKTLTLLNLDRGTGAERWRASIKDETPQPTHSTNPFGSATPTADEQRVVVWYGNAGLHAYNHQGELQWSVATPAVRHIWGYGSSPVLREGRVYLNTGVGAEAFLAAYDARDGKEVWKTPEPPVREENQRGGEIGTWSSPTFAMVDGKTQVLVSQPTRVNGYDLETGEILWYCEGLANLPRGNLVYTSLVLSEDVGAALGGYNGPAIGFKLGGKGNVTETNRLWRHTMSNPQRIGSGVVLGGKLFHANAGPGFIQCLDLQSGEELWRARPAAGGNFWGSIVYAGDRLYVTNQEGTTLVFAPNTEKFELIAENRLGERSNSTPAVAGNDIIIRTFGGVYCIREE